MKTSEAKPPRRQLRAHHLALGLVLGAYACGACAADLDGAQLSPWWGLPFVGVLLSIALVPLAAPIFWHRHFGALMVAWALAFLLPFAVLYGWGTAAQHFVHVLLAEYLPFVILLTALYTISGGIHVRGHWRASAAGNTGILALGAVLASFMGTTGASMLLIRPLLRANAARRRQAHVVVFFIFIVSNAGGALTPLGDPPLFLGFLQGVDFFWTLRHLAAPAASLVGVLLLGFYLLDAWLLRRESTPSASTPAPAHRQRLGFDGSANFALLLAVVALVLMSGLWRSGVQWSVAGTTLALPGLLRDLGLIAVTLVSLRITAASVHQANAFDWGPMREVAKLFAAIFITIVPVIAMLKAGHDGAFAAVVAAVTRADGTPDAAMYFWMTGLLSSFLDNAPTYLVFFNTAGGDAAQLMQAGAATLAAISAGAVFMGANTYIGNAPNLMVKAIAEERGVKMPSFFGYMAWSIPILLPLFALMGWVWFA